MWGYRNPKDLYESNQEQTQDSFFDGDELLREDKKNGVTKKDTNWQQHSLSAQVWKSKSDNRDGSICTGWQARSIWLGRRRHKHKLSKGSKVDFNQLKGDKT